VRLRERSRDDAVVARDRVAVSPTTRATSLGLTRHAITNPKTIAAPRSSAIRSSPVSLGSGGHTPQPFESTASTQPWCHPSVQHDGSAAHTQVRDHRQLAARLGMLTAARTDVVRRLTGRDVARRRARGHRRRARARVADATAERGDLLATTDATPTTSAARRARTNVTCMIETEAFVPEGRTNAMAGTPPIASFLGCACE